MDNAFEVFVQKDDPNQIMNLGAVIIKQAKNHVGRLLKFFENCNFVRYFLWCHFNPMVIMGSCVK